MFFSLYGASPQWECTHRHSNALLLVDAARKVLGEGSPAAVEIVPRLADSTN